MSLWDTFKSAAEKAGEVTKLAGTKAKLNTEILMTDRQINQRKYKFGLDMYEYVSPLTASTDFYASNDKLTNTIRPPLITAQKEVAALLGKQASLKEQINMAEIQRQSAFNTPAQTLGGKMKNAGKSASMAGTEAKLHTELAVCNTKITHIQQEFGVELYAKFEHLEDSEGWLPTNREIRSLYDATRSDIDKYQRQKLEKQKELEVLGGPRAPQPKSTFMETPVVQAHETTSTPTTLNGRMDHSDTISSISSFTASTFTTPPSPTTIPQAQPIGNHTTNNANAFGGTHNGFAQSNNTNYNTTSGNYPSSSMNGFSSPQQTQQQQHQQYHHGQTTFNTTANSHTMTQAQGIFAGVPGAGSYGGTSTSSTPSFQQQQQSLPSTAPKKDPFQNNDDLISWDYD